MQINKSLPLIKQKGFQLFLMNVPFIVMLFIFSYMPLRGWIYAFYDYKPGRLLANCEFVGMKYFFKLFSTAYYRKEFVRVIGNTLGISLLGYLFTTLPMFFAMFLNEVRSRKARKIIQTTTTLPNFISWVIVYGVAFSMFSVGDGFVNKLLIMLGLIDKEINFLIQADAIWLKMVLWGIWKGLGWSAILYFAAIAGVDQEIYESAWVDGAGRFRTMWSITMPQLLPTFFVMFILSIANFLNTGMEQFYVFANPLIVEKLEVLDLYVYHQGIGKMQYSFTTAIGMMKSVIAIILLFFANKAAKRVRGSGIM